MAVAKLGAQKRDSALLDERPRGAIELAKDGLQGFCRKRALLFVDQRRQFAGGK